MTAERTHLADLRCLATLAASDKQYLDMFVKAVAKLDHHFNNGMVSGDDFTIKLELHGNRHKLIHARVICDEFERPDDKKTSN